MRASMFLLGVLLLSALPPFAQGQTNLHLEVAPAYDVRPGVAHELPLAATRGCGSQGGVRFDANTTLWPEILRASADWGPCVGNAQQASANLTFTPAADAAAGSYPMRVWATDWGSYHEVFRDTVVRVLFDADLLLDGPATASAAAGVPLALPLVSSIRANANASLSFSLAPTTPRGWAMQAAPVPAYAAGTGETWRNVTATLTPPPDARGPATVGVVLTATPPQDVPGGAVSAWMNLSVTVAPPEPLAVQVVSVSPGAPGETALVSVRAQVACGEAEAATFDAVVPTFPVSVRAISPAGACDDQVQLAQTTLAVPVPASAAAGLHAARVAVHWGKAQAEADFVLPVPFAGQLMASGSAPARVASGDALGLRLRLDARANGPAVFQVEVESPAGWSPVVAPAAPYDPTEGWAPRDVAVRLQPPPDASGFHQIAVRARLVPAAGAPLESLWTAVVEAHVPAPLALSTPQIVATDGAPASVRVSATRGCRAQPEATFTLALHDGVVAARAATWGACRADGLQTATALLRPALPPDLRAGEHLLHVHASSGREAAASSIAYPVPFAATLDFVAAIPDEVAPGEPFDVGLRGQVRANAPATLVLALELPPGWTWTLVSPPADYDPAEGAAERGALVRVIPDGDGAGARIGFTLQAVPEGLEAPPATWTAQSGVAILDPFPWHAALAVLLAVGLGGALLAWRLLRGPTLRPPPETAAPPPPEARAGAAPAAALLPRPPRYVNVAVAPGAGEPPLPRAASLATGRTYRLLVNVAGLDPRSVVENAVENPFRDDLLPPAREGHWLDVVAVSDELDIPEPQRSFFLPPEGPSFACPCAPGGPHACAPESRRAWVELAARAPDRPCEARVRIGVYCRNHLLQSQLLHADVAVDEGAGRGHASRIDYQLTAAFTDMAAIRPRAVHVLTNDVDPTTHRLVVKGPAGDVFSFALTEGQMREAVDAARQALADAHAEEFGGGLGAKKQRRSLLLDDNRKGKDAFVADLRRLAPLGATLFQALFKGQGGRRNAAREALTGPQTTLQVSRMGGTGLVFPWALVYDIGLEDDERLWTLCPMVDVWDGRGDLFDPAACRPEDHRHGKNVLCPWGFWGYRHLIEQPPSMPPDRGLPERIVVRGAHPRVVVGLSLELQEKVTEAHLLDVRDALRVPDVRVAASRAGVAEALAATDLEIAYFYCHGRRTPIKGARESIPALAVGKGELVTPNDVATWSDYDWSRDHWRATPPLVFINGCHTTELTPEALVSFVDSFADAYAAGVLGTEVAMLQPMASEMAARFLRGFRDQSAGEALLLARRQFLAKGNLLGLAYTLHACSDLRLVQAPLPGGT